MNNKGLHITVNRKSLDHILSFANSVIEKRNVINELGNIKLSANDNLIEIVATDMNIYISQFIDIFQFHSGEVVVSGKLLSDVIKKIPGQDIILQISEDKNYLQISGDNCQFNLFIFPASDFHSLAPNKANSTLNIKASDLVKLIESTYFAAASEEARYNLNGIYLHLSKDKFCAVATDGHRLSFSAIKSLASGSDKFGIILPTKSAQELMKLLKDSANIASDVEIALSLNIAKFSCNKSIIISKIIDGTFPEYEHFFPRDNPNKLIINTSLLSESIDRASLVTMEKFKAIKILIDKESHIEITASNDSKGSSLEKIKYSKEAKNFCEYLGQDNISIGFNPKYLSDVLGNIKYEKVEIFFKDSFSPVLIKGDDDNLFVIMPVNI